MNKNFWFLFGFAVVLAYLAGKYGAPESEKTKKRVETLTTENTTLKEKINAYLVRELQSEKTRTVTTIKKPDGTEISRARYRSTRRTDERSRLSSEVENNSQSRALAVATEEREVKRGGGPILQAMAGISPTNLTQGMNYGGMITLQILGPIFGSAWVLTNQFSVGIAAGLRF